MERTTKRRWKSLLAKAKAGSPEAQWEVGLYCQEGAKDGLDRLLVRANQTKARRWYTLAAEQGDQWGQLALSNMLSSGKRGDRDYKGAIYWAKRAIAQGCASAAFNLGTIYRDENKPSQAFRCYCKALSMGEKGALLQVGLCCLFGLGTRQDLAEARRHLEKLTTCDSNLVCQRDLENAHYWLAILQLLKTTRLDQSRTRARALLEYANADEDHEQARDLLNLLGRSKFLPVRPINRQT